jgi:uncharacterized membrane protein
MSDVEAAVKTTPAAQWDRTAPGQSSRLLSVDFMRGRVMVIMVLGLICTAAFILLRAFNAYGNPSAGVAGNSPGPWHPQITLAMGIVSFLDLEKYPPSLQFLLMTLGP